MTEDEAIRIAQKYVREHGVAAIFEPSKVRHVTAETLDAIRRQLDADGARPPSEDIYRRLREEVERRSRWEVFFPFPSPATTECCPSGAVILVYDDNCEAEGFHSL
jgi:hypothetical protein